jgi:hypothetical protein
MSVEMEALMVLGIFAGFMAALIYILGDGLEDK